MAAGTRDYTRQELLDSTLQIVLQPPSGLARRTYLLIQNNSSYSIYVNPDSPANDYAGTEVPAGQFYEREAHPPQNILYVSGAGAAGSQQRIKITEGWE